MRMSSGSNPPRCSARNSRIPHPRSTKAPYGALALIPIERAAFSYQPNDLKSARRALRDRFLLDTLVRREPTNLPSTLHDTLRFTFVSLRRKRSFSWPQPIHQINGAFFRQVIGFAGRSLLLSPR